MSAVDGYWDYPLEDRGLLFAPVYFNSPLWQDPSWCYQPSFCIGFGGLFGSLFANPFYCHYYFGDYYSPACIDLGFSPWFSYCHHCYDPLFGYYGWIHRGDRGWYPGLVNTYRGRLAGDLLVPPRTLAQQNALALNFNNTALNTNVTHNTLNTVQMVKPLHELSASGAPLTRLEPTQVSAARETGLAFRKAAVDRQRLETSSASQATRPTALSLANLPARAAVPSLGKLGSHTDPASRPALGAGPQAKAVGPRLPDFGGPGRASTRSATGPPASAPLGSPRHANQPSTPATVHSVPRSGAEAPNRSFTPQSFDRSEYRGSVPRNGSEIRSQPAPHYQTRPSFQPSGPAPNTWSAPSYRPQPNWTPPTSHQAPRMTPPASRSSYRSAPAFRGGDFGSGQSFVSPGSRSPGSSGSEARSSGSRGGGGRRDAR